MPNKIKKKDMDGCVCERCGKIHAGTYGSGRFCSQVCARGFSTSHNRDEINAKKSLTLKAKYTHHDKVCPYCSKSFIVTDSRSQRIYCSRSCASKAQHERFPNHLKAQSRIGGLHSVVSQHRRSKNEIHFYELCSRQFPDALCNEPMFSGWDADIIIPSLKIAVLWNGVWHYKKIAKNHSLKQVENRDKIKLIEIKKSGYTPYIIKDMGRYDISFVEMQFNQFVNFLDVNLRSGNSIQNLIR